MKYNYEPRQLNKMANIFKNLAAAMIAEQEESRKREGLTALADQMVDALLSTATADTKAEKI